MQKEIRFNNDEIRDAIGNLDFHQLDMPATYPDSKPMLMFNALGNTLVHILILAIMKQHKLTLEQAVELVQSKWTRHSFVPGEFEEFLQPAVDMWVRFSANKPDDYIRMDGK